MDNGSSVSPLYYVGALERRLAGWAITRAFERNTPHFAGRIKREGREAAALNICGRMLGLYFIVLGMPGAIAASFGVVVVAVLLLAPASVCILLSVRCNILQYRAIRGFRETGG